MRHCMLDLETWGTIPGSALRSIGAVMFELDGAMGDKFYANIAFDQANGLSVDPKTVEWWDDPRRDKARELLMDDQQPLSVVVDAFHGFFVENAGVYLWSHGANFDSVLWECAARAVNRRVPWQFWNVSCTRTLYRAYNFDPKSIEFKGIEHFALDDALHQTACVQRAHESVRIERFNLKEEIQQKPLRLDPQGPTAQTPPHSFTMK